MIPYQKGLPLNLGDVLLSFVLVVLALGYYQWQPATRLGVGLVRIGEWSYALYLGHNLCLGIAAPLLLRLQLNLWLHAAALFAIVFPITVALSGLSYHFLERRFMRLGAPPRPS